jgi:hypothetical protein
VRGFGDAKQSEHGLAAPAYGRRPCVGGQQCVERVPDMQVRGAGSRRAHANALACYVRPGMLWACIANTACPRMHGASDGGAMGQELTALANELEAVRQELQAERKKRDAERAGRIRAEAQLRKRLVGDESPGPAGSEGTGAGADIAGGVQASHAGGSGVEMKVIGRMRSCFRRRFGAPRQGSVVAGSRGMLRMTAECNASVSTHSLDQYSHVWLIYVFHENTNLGRYLPPTRSLRGMPRRME